MQIDLRLLRHALALAEHRSFQRAADALGTSQPTLSRSIAALEERVGLLLFARSRAGVEPTDFGRLFLEHAEDIVSRSADLVREIALAKGLQSGEVSVGLGAYVLHGLPSAFASRYAVAHPAIRLRIVAETPAVLARMLRARTIDLAVAEGTVLGESEDLDVLAHLEPVPGWIVVRAGHPLTQTASPTFQGVLRYPYAQVVMLPPRLLKPILEARNAPACGSGPTLPFPAIECPTADLALAIVASSDAFTFSALHPIRDALARRRLVPLLQPDWLGTKWVIARLRNRTPSPATVALVAEIQRSSAELVREESALGAGLKPWSPQTPRSSRSRPSAAATASAADPPGPRPTRGAARRR